MRPLAILGFALCLPCTARSQGNEAWRTDLEFIRREIPLRHANAFHALTKAHFEDELDRLESRLPGLDRSAVILGIARIVASIGDGHTQMFLGSDEKIGFHALPVRFFWFEEGLTVVATPAEEDWALGKRVSRVGNVPIAEVVERLEPLVNGDNEMTVRDVLPNLLRLREGLHAPGDSGGAGAGP